MGELKKQGPNLELLQYHSNTKLTVAWTEVVGLERREVDRLGCSLELRAHRAG